MIIADTSLWIEYLRQSDHELIPAFRKYLNESLIIAVSPVFGQLLQGAKSKREKNIIEEFWSALSKVGEKETFIDAGRLANKYKLPQIGVGLIGSYILSLALQNDFALWSLDKKLNKAIDLINDD